MLSKAHNVLRAAVVPRVLPPAMSLTSANARLSVFGLATAAVAGGDRRRRSPRSLGFGWELGATAAVFLVAGRARGPAAAARRRARPASCRPTCSPPRRSRSGRDGAARVSPHVVLALRANAALRGLGGFLTIFAAFLVQATFPGGWEATLALGALAVAAGVGSFAGTARRVAAARRRPRPARAVLGRRGGRRSPCWPRSSTASRWPPSSCCVSAVTNALGKVSLDAIIQREVPENLRASAFARSETMLQLAWVVGGALRDRAAADRLAGLHRRRGAAGARRRPDRSGACTAAGRGRTVPAGLPRRPDDPRGAAVVVSTRAPPPLLLARSLAGCGRGSAAGARRTSRSRSAPQKVAVQPDPVLPGRRRAALHATPRRSSRSSPDSPITLTVPDAVAERGWSVQVFDEKLEKKLGEVDVPKGKAVLRPRSTPPTSSRRRSTW